MSLRLPLTAILATSALMINAYPAASAEDTEPILFQSSLEGLTERKQESATAVQQFSVAAIETVKYEHLTPDNISPLTLAKLQYLGYLDPEVNQWTDQVVNALIRFQRDYQVPASGSMTEETKRALFNGESGSYTAQQEWSEAIDAHLVDLESLQSSDVQQRSQIIQQILVLRQLRQAGFYTGQGVANLNHLSNQGKELLEIFKTPEAQAFLEMISFAEGTQRPNPRNSFLVRFGGPLINSFANHPLIIWKGISSATGKFQFMDYTWPGVSNRLGTTNFTPLEQSLAALYQMRHKRQLNLEDFTGNFESNIYKAAKEWASLPCGPGRGSCYTLGGAPQPNKSMEALRSRYLGYVETYRNNPEFSQLVYWGEEETKALREFNYAYQINTEASFNNPEVLRALFEGEFGQSATPDIRP